MKRTIVVALILGLVAGAMALPAEAKKKKKKKPVPSEQQFFLRDADGCDTTENLLSVEDGTDDGCWYVDSGLLFEVVVGAGLLTPQDLSQTWNAIDGTPFILDASRPITGEITSASGQCIQDPACSPAGLGAGQAELDVTLVGIVGGEEVELGTYSEAFAVAPGQTHTSKVSIELDPALANAPVESLTLSTYMHGAAVGHGIVVLDDPASFIKIPSFTLQ